MQPINSTPRYVVGAALVWLITSLLSHAADFERDVAPLLAKRCIECHNATDKAGGLNLTTAAGLNAGGESGPAISTTRPESSHLIERITRGEMPPPKQGKPRNLPASEVETLREWVAAKTPWPEGRILDLFERTTELRAGRDWWSLQPVRQAEVPPLNPSQRSVNAIDAFVWQKLSEQSLQLAPEADRRTLIRRASFDLTGLPPSATEIEAFEQDSSPAAYEHLIDRLLNSPHYGEKWARYWLDVARFSETSGYERDQEKPGIWKYRDWVVQAFNSDMPFDRFVIEQLAGDEIPQRTEQSTIATGFLAAGTWNDEPNDPDEYQYDRLEDLVHVTTTAFLGLTVKCARCHEHKFDPLSQVDYYRVANAFWAGPVAMRDRKWIGGPSKEEIGFDVFGWTDLSRDPRPLHLLKKGDPKQPGPVVEPGHLSAIRWLDRAVAPPPPDAKTTTRRLQLAHWIADPKNPLTARLFVNRVWQQHFAKGLVRSPDNFGFNGDKPTHPELLDWLAHDFVANGWKIKRLHKLLLMSAVWRQSSLHPEHEKYEQLDSDNRLWWRAERRRLDAEGLRDALLSASGQLDLRLGGPSFKPTISDAALEGLSQKQKAWQSSPANEQRRRSLYIYSKRGLLSPLMTTFDLPDTTLPCGQRDVSTVAPQALALLNSEFAHQQAEALARRIESESSNPTQQTTLAWRYTLGRSASSKETAAALAHMAQQAKLFTAAAPSRDSSQQDSNAAPVTSGLVLSLRADQNVTLDADGNVARWGNRASDAHAATQDDPKRRPRLVHNAANGHPVIRFNGQRQFLSIAGSLLSSQQFTLAAVATDVGKSGHRELISNWNRASNVTSSLFFGLTGESNVRLSDYFVVEAQIPNRSAPFALVGIASADSVGVFLNNVTISKRQEALAERRFTTPWVIAQQGDIDGEYWHGDIAELLVFNRALSEGERGQLWNSFRTRYAIPPTERPQPTPAHRALASLCLVLLNSNEFAYID